MLLNNRINFTVKESAYILFVLLLFQVPLPWFFAWTIAVAIHELCHYMSVRILGGCVREITVGIGGVYMRSDPMTRWKSIFAILSGPIGGFMPVFLRNIFPRLAICCWLLSVYNLLPFSFLDGGHALQLLISKNKYIHFIEYGTLIMLFLGAVYACLIWNIGYLPLVIVTVLWLRNRNRPCKAVFKKVQ